MKVSPSRPKRNHRPEMLSDVSARELPLVWKPHSVLGWYKDVKASPVLSHIEELAPLLVGGCLRQEQVVSLLD